jgi:hypothetical protein
MPMLEGVPARVPFVPPREVYMPENPVERWHRIVLTQEVAGLSDWLAEDAVSHSPVAVAPQCGREAVTRYLQAALHVFLNPSFRCVRKIVAASHGLYEFETLIDRVWVNAGDLITGNGEGRVVDFKAMVRPLRAIIRAQQKMAAMLESAPARAGTFPSEPCQPTHGQRSHPRG